MSRAVLALGSNLGDRHAAVRAALSRLSGYLVTVSSGYETQPWGDPDQPPYLNAVAIVDHAATHAYGWLALAHQLEREAGRVRDPARPFGPRTLDVDVIAVWDNGNPVVQDDPALTLPHPRAHLRAFVLVPWSQIEPDAVLPGHGPVGQLLRTGAVAADVPGVRNLGPLRDA